LRGAHRWTIEQADEAYELVDKLVDCKGVFFNVGCHSGARAKPANPESRAIISGFRIGADARTRMTKLKDKPMSHDRSTVEAVVQHYFDGLYEGSADKLGAIFHPSADLRWLEQGELQILTVPDWLDRVRKRPSAKAEGKRREDFIVTIDRSDDSTAFIKLRCQLPPRYFTDYLVAMKLADGWQIVSKSYRYDMRE
jgi:hypothetical protein